MPIRLSASSRISPVRTAEQDHFQAAVLVQMHMSGGHDPLKLAVLEFGEPLGDPAGVVIVDQA